MRSQKELDAATAIARAKRKPNFMVIEVSYNTRLLVPHEDGLQIIAALKNAELLEEQYGSRPQIFPMGKDSFRTSYLSPEYYEDIKVSMLLNLTIEELHEARLKPLTEPA